MPCNTNYRTLIKASALTLVSSCLGGQAPTSFGSEQGFAGHHIKAAFILNFPNFITWPNPSEDGINTICTFRDDAVADSIELLLASKKMAARRATIQFLRDPEIEVRCDLVFIGKKAKQSVDEISQPERTAKALMVSDIPDYAASGGMIELALVDNNIQVILNRDVVKSRGFIVDSRLLQLTREAPTWGAQVAR